MKTKRRSPCQASGRCCRRRRLRCQRSESRSPRPPCPRSLRASRGGWEGQERCCSHPRAAPTKKGRPPPARKPQPILESARGSRQAPRRLMVVQTGTETSSGGRRYGSSWPARIQPTAHRRRNAGALGSICRLLVSPGCSLSHPDKVGTKTRAARDRARGRRRRRSARR